MNQRYFTFNQHLICALNIADRNTGLETVKCNANAIKQQSLVQSLGQSSDKKNQSET